MMAIFFKDSRNFIGISFSDMTFFNSFNDNYNIENILKENNRANIGSIEFHRIEQTMTIIKEVIKDCNLFLLKL